MEQPSILLIIARITLVLGILGFGQHRRWSLDLSILGAATALGLSYGIAPLRLVRIMIEGCTNIDLMALLVAVTGILAFSGLLDSTGQTHRLTEGIRARIKSPKIRLAFFPALIGLLPMPGGAIFSCPMVKELSASMPVTNMYRALVNIWFRHIWETVWPLYPGFVLACLLSGMSPYTYIINCLPVLFISVLVGWFLYLRSLPMEDAPRELIQQVPFTHILHEGFPIIVGIGVSCILYAIFNSMPAGFCFGIGFFTGIAVCAVQNKSSLDDVTKQIATRKNFRMLTIILAIFVFKNVLSQCGLIAEMGAIARGSQSFLLAACIILPIVGGVLTGILMGAVGVTFPVIIELIQQANLWDERAIWFSLTLCMCFLGEMLSPVHVCIVLSSNYFNVNIIDVLKRLIIPSALTAILATMFYGIFLVF